jgi:hypothetical protein
MHKSRYKSKVQAELNSLKAAKNAQKLDSFWPGEIRTVYDEERARQVRERFVVTPK